MSDNMSLGLATHGVDAAFDGADGRYYTIPFVVGLEYPISAGSGWLYFAGEGGFFLLSPPDLQVDGETLSADVATKVGFGGTVGYQFGNYMGLAVKYWPLGKLDVSYDLDDDLARTFDVSYFDIVFTFARPR